MQFLGIRKEYNPIVLWYTTQVMEKLKTVEVKHYPFSSQEPIDNVRTTLCEEMKTLVVELGLSSAQEQEWAHYFTLHLVKTEDMYLFEERLREQGEARANLSYHGRRHGVYQVAYDSIGLVKAILAREDALSRYLSLEVIFAAVDSEIKHDSGYVEDSNSPNFAARLPIHVIRSMAIAREINNEIGLPSFLNPEKVNELEEIGIHATNFPFDEDRRRELSQMLENLQYSTRQEAHIVRLISSLADLGGQVARIDYTELLFDLRNEFNSEKAGKGDEIIGLDHDEMARKCRGFIENVIIKGNVGKIANAFLGPDNIYQKAWTEHLTSLAV